ncbi:ArpU family phage packaging/lysis transcriptional regulator [Peribacillus frigoritolerans]|uniref:ArpU family phage packaging/lysis transcriptional regulator n=1 Tax=Peribacillus frigoritolerans TaxID=450367 RepID=UPI00203F11A0|nr:ArpU family phage packaging/lysis transcriptional regulator [Peribacillus frigoritolerans]MCM3169003.1 ArpU family transcriptional regulator [Peribacillus frigoritolerans]
MKEAAIISSKTESFIQTKQLSLFEEVNEKEVRKTIARELKHYKALRVALRNKSELLEEGMNPLFPAFRNKDKEKEFKVRQINRTLENVLDDVERQIIEQKYLSSNRVKDINLYLEMGLTKDQYYIHKRQAIFLIATALSVI